MKPTSMYELEFRVQFKRRTSHRYFVFRHLNRMAVYHFFGWLWMMNFVIALGECVLAGAFASWYFAFHKPDVSIVQNCRAISVVNVQHEAWHGV